MIDPAVDARDEMGSRAVNEHLRWERRDTRKGEMSIGVYVKGRCLQEGMFPDHRQQESLEKAGVGWT